MMNRKGFIFGLSMLAFFTIVLLLVLAIVFFGLFIRQLIGVAMLVYIGFVLYKAGWKIPKNQKVSFWVLLALGLLLILNPFSIFGGLLNVVV